MKLIEKNMEMHERSLVKLDNRDAKIVLALNVLLVGTGTIYAGIKVKGEVMINNVILGLIQMALTPFFLIGWFWSLILGLQIYHLSHSQNLIEPPKL